MNLDNLKNIVFSEDGAKELEEFLQSFIEREVTSVEDLKQWIYDYDKINSCISERFSRNYADFNSYNNDKDIKKKYDYDNEVLIPLVNKYEDKINRFVVENPFKKDLDSYYTLMIKRKENSIEIFREENIPLKVEENKYATKYYEITGAMTVEFKGEEKTLQQMSPYMESEDRDVRREAFELVNRRRLQNKEELDDIMDNLIKIRHKIALNAGFSNYRDYMFKAMERFDYTPEDCFNFHEAVKKYVVPLKEEIEKEHKKRLGVENYKPYDVSGTPKGEKPLRPFETIEELIDGVTRMFRRTDPYFEDVMNLMKENKTLDLESRKNKSPGGFCDFFRLSEVPFIFMSTSNTQDDMATLCHEGGHSVHAMLCKDINVKEYKDTPSEIAELASMSMELITMDKWEEFYKNKKDLNRAKREHLEGIITFLPWAMVVDKFQHYLYTNPNASKEERNKSFNSIAKEFTATYVDWDGYEEELLHMWKRQLHIFEVPFYYIEYAIAQLGSLQVYRNYVNNKEEAIKNYKKALTLGSSKGLKELYDEASISFDFSENTIKELMEFIKSELNKVNS
ncbi:M3 family oligoendopeptidase [Clostridium sp.]|uniref:M3 family oligoendopeptidase n=1 Tax=Clostridium sp. TaxID=1506 RepID=UPI00346437CC